ncbi:TraR/DksA family transcriptional regulator [Parathalassolituus penaei]|uniref:TraR/DksA family transcriptional regulator n=1 Tax=Parathalassolituus penaei TaxID=2997323 RepID=A0A9X3IVG6_9GAMM|nr:TraR/DksA family transcriptional regulator [Parathalassolituus penaei]MCY0967238.1 TraR/DksA family transcriptional regulator [Parathalassolituus penaei]
MNLQDVHTRLEERLSELTERAERAEKHASHREEAVSADFAEQATERENDEVLASIGDEARVEADQIRQALRRLDAGNYGECFECGEAIEPARLLAVPYATRCMQCAARMEHYH